MVNNRLVPARIAHEDVPNIQITRFSRFLNLFQQRACCVVSSGIVLFSPPTYVEHQPGLIDFFVTQNVATAFEACLYEAG